MMSVFEVMIILMITLIFHFKIGKYPDPLQRSEQPKREIKEVLIMWIIPLIWVTLYGYLLYWPFIVNFFRDRLIGVLINTVFFVIPDFIIPLYVVLKINNWNAQDLGLTNHLKSNIVGIFAVLFGLGAGIIKYIISFLPPPLGYLKANLITLIILLFSNAFAEELFYRAIVQSKLERALGQKKALLYTAILFGLSHLPQYLNVFVWGFNGDYIEAILGILYKLVSVTLTGLIFGIIYMKTRNVFPGTISHYFYNWIPDIILLFI